MHWWCVDLDVPLETSAGLYATLTPDEQDRSARLRFEHDRRRFVVARGVLRDILGRYLGTQPRDLRFVHTEFGKPELGPSYDRRLRFNLSHSGDLALIAIAADAELGVDLEYIRALPESAEIAAAVFSPAEAAELDGLPRHLRAEAFLSCWTQKEAYAKACGRGLAESLTGMPAVLAPWSLYRLQPGPGYVGSLAVEGSDWRLRQRHWRADHKM